MWKRQDPSQLVSGNIAPARWLTRNTSRDDVKTAEMLDLNLVKSDHSRSEVGVPRVFKEAQIIAYHLVDEVTEIQHSY